MSTAAVLGGDGGSELKRMPHVKPPFTLSDIKKVIPPHCFERSLVQSFGHIIHDLAIMVEMCYAAALYIPLLPVMYRHTVWLA